ncbi:MAG: pilus assembly protein [Candidatus Obscuribacterales bacterium]|nr:pilus assembly protein [Candidatus Obscuribacterales bacterium]
MKSRTNSKLLSRSLSSSGILLCEKKQRRKSAQALVEFALSIPFLILAIVAIVYFGKAFYVKQVLSYAAQNAARSAARMPRLSDESVRDSLRGFSVDGALIGPDDPQSNPSPVYRALSAAHMLSSDDGMHGDLPEGASVQILPFDEGESNSEIVTVKIQYPFGLMHDWRSNQGDSEFGETITISEGVPNSGISFGESDIIESASAAQEIYQQ